MNNTISLIGNTPLINLDLGIKNADIFAKLEAYNLTGSIKDRMALYMMITAEKKGLLKKNYTIIEATTGNTGISFSALAAIRGYKMIAVMPENQSAERIKMMKAFGTEVVLTPKEKGPQGAIDYRNKLMEVTKNAWTPDQFANMDNPRAHELTTAKEIIKQAPKSIDYFIHGIGTGGTLIGIAHGLKKSYPKIKIIAVEPIESAVLSGKKAGKHNIQGIGEGFIPKIVDKKYIDEVVAVSTKDAVFWTNKIAKQLGLLVGFSSGANIAAIVKISHYFNKPKKIITIFADRGERYLSII